jgi:hypothetical protein
MRKIIVHRTCITATNTVIRTIEVRIEKLIGAATGADIRKALSTCTGTITTTTTITDRQ